MKKVKPIAYYRNLAFGDVKLWTPNEDHPDSAKPLFSEEQLFAPLELSEEAHFEFRLLWSKHYGLGAAIDKLFQSKDSNGDYSNLFRYIWDWNTAGPENRHNERILSLAYALMNYEEEHPERTINVSKKGWYIRSKGKSPEDIKAVDAAENPTYLYLSRVVLYGIPCYKPTPNKSEAAYFYTKEEAEALVSDWNEAVYLPVEKLK